MSAPIILACIAGAIAGIVLAFWELSARHLWQEIVIVAVVSACASAVTFAIASWVLS
jgi:hypothetical protein